MVRRVVSLCLAFAFPVLLASSPAHADSGSRHRGSGHGIQVDRVTFPVTLSDGGTYQIVGYRYHRPGAHGPLQVLVHGATYDHRYWDAGTLDGVEYSYARYMAARGHDVLAIDQLGAGESSKPSGYFLNLSETADSVGQLLASLRTRQNPLGKRFHSIALVGHSNGSITAIREESIHHQADALVVTGWGHTATPLPLDPAPILALLQAPYLPSNAFPEPFRAFLFYHAPSTDPAMPQYDATTLASTMASGQFIDTFGVAAAPTLDGVADVTGPVLVQLGDHDLLSPASNAALEAGYWTSASSVDVQALPEMGHDVNLHLNHAESWTEIDAWVRATTDQDDDDNDD